MTFGLRLPDPVGLFVDDVLGQSANAAPSLVIEELNGQRRKITLGGRAKSYSPMSLGSAKMRSKITWYQGNPTATQQVLGPELGSCTLEGKWKDRFLSGAEAEGGTTAILMNDSPDEVRSAEQAVQLFYDLTSSGSTVRVVWGSEVREGIFVSFDPKYDRQSDVAWEMQFEWNGRGQTAPRKVEATVSSDDLLSWINGLDDQLAFAQDVARAFNAQLLDTVGSVRESVSVLFGALRTVEAVGNTQRRTLGAIAQAADSIRLELTEEIQRLTESSIIGDVDAVSITARPSALMATEAFRRKTARMAFSVRHTALTLDYQVQLRNRPREITTISVPQDTSLYSISLRYYGTPDFAGYLARVNGLEKAVAIAGTQLRIPPRPPQLDDAASAGPVC